MKGHLRYAASEYTQDADDRGIRPISAVDCEIITELVQILQRKNLSGVAKVLDRWKAVEDDTILDHLLNENEANEIDGYGDSLKESDGMQITFIQIKNHIFQAHELFSIETNSMYKNGRIIYYMIINGVDETMASIKGVKKTNVTIQYNSEKQRNDEVEQIKSKLTQYTNCIFL